MPSKPSKARRSKTGDSRKLEETVDVECQTDFYDEVFAKHLQEIDEAKTAAVEDNK